jgi:hypothetical protein
MRVAGIGHRRQGDRAAQVDHFHIIPPSPHRQKSSSRVSKFRQLGRQLFAENLAIVADVDREPPGIDVKCLDRFGVTMPFSQAA